jgi:hypothetical protein
MILGEQKPGGKRNLIKQIKGKYNQLYNGAWNELDLSKSSKRALAGAGMILLIGAMASYSIITKND